MYVARRPSQVNRVLEGLWAARFLEAFCTAEVEVTRCPKQGLAKETGSRQLVAAEAFRPAEACWPAKVELVDGEWYWSAEAEVMEGGFWSMEVELARWSTYLGFPKGIVAVVKDAFCWKTQNQMKCWFDLPVDAWNELQSCHNLQNLQLSSYAYK